MITRISRTIAGLIALLTFVVIGARVIDSLESWECTCIHPECDWCTNSEPIDLPHCTADCMCIECYWLECATEAADQFTALFNSYEVKFSKNGRTMIRQGDSGSFKFAKKG